jgi:hypothetical protein
LVKELSDPKFIIPLRLAPFKKLFGIGELQYIDFVRGWADGLGKLLDTLKRQHVPCDPSRIQIDPNWEIIRRRGAIPIKQEPERLTSNWLRIAEAPDCIRYFEPTGADGRLAVSSARGMSKHPMETHMNGFFSFGTADEINEAFASIGKFAVKHECDLIKFIKEGAIECDIRKQDASNKVHSMFRLAWNSFCRKRGLLEYRYSTVSGFHICKDQAKIGQKIAWGRQGDRRSSMLRNVAKGRVWQFGVSGLPAFWPFPHFKLKSRVLFSPMSGEEAADPFDDAKKQHRLRRTICKGWRNKQWHGRIMAFVELLSGDSSYIRLVLGETAHVTLEAAPILFTSPISTPLPDAMSDEQEESDESTLGRPEPEDDQ